VYLAIAGNIGVGKSSLTRILSERYRLKPIFEAVDENPYLEDFYRDMPRYAFQSQMFFLARRLEQHLSQVNPGERIIQDRTIYEDAAIFARNLHQEGQLDERDYRSYCRMYQAILGALRPPDLLVYLEAGLPTLRRRIAQRGRAYEADIDDGYLARLNRLYTEWVGRYTLSELLVIPTDGLDFVNRDSDRHRVLDLLEQRGLMPPLVT
jgi:deoxyadenosine/deoxycytidine kinase